jgi:hypothetical protein
MRGRRTWLVLLLAALIGGSAALASSGGGSSRSAVAELETYERQVLPIVQDGGRVVEQGMKPAMDDLQYQHIVPPSVIGTEGDGWVRSLTNVRERLRRVATPASVRPVTTAFVSSLDAYIAAARSFSAAARTVGVRRAANLERGFSQAIAADRIYDEGSAHLQKLRHALGLASNPDFPEVSGA